MTKRCGHLTVAALTAAVLLSAARPAVAGSIPQDTAWAEGTSWHYHESYLGLRDVWVYVPSTTSPRASGLRGAVFHLLGCGQMTFQVAQASGWPEAAEAYGLVIIVPGIIRPVHPNPSGPQVECLNYGYDGGYGTYTPSRTDADHAALIAAGRALVEDAAYAELGIDANQIYIAGLSAGGTVAMQVACMAPDVFAGVATSAAPSMGASQGTAVMPPTASFTASTVVSRCQSYAEGSSDPDALSRQLYAIISDDSSLRPGAVGMDTSWFEDQDYWDGDKFCPHQYHEINAQAFSTILGLGSTPAETRLVVGHGSGIGCAGGESSSGASGEVACPLPGAITRDWTALADIWRDGSGAARVVRIEQDTLRHTWPSGPAGPGDVAATPTREQLQADGYQDPTTLHFTNMEAAPNGTFGVINFNLTALDYPMLVANYWTHNNPRLGAPTAGAENCLGPEGDCLSGGEVVPPPPEEGAPSVSITGVESGAGGCVVATGTASDDSAVAEVTAVVLGLGPLPAALSGETWTVEVCDLLPGTYSLFAVARDDAGIESPPSTVADIAVAGTGGLEVAEGTLTEHCDQGRVTRYTSEYYALLGAHCAWAGVAYDCESFPLYRCGAEGAWSEEEPACSSSEVPVVSLSASLSLSATEVGVGETLTIDIAVTNDGPDAGSAFHVLDRLPPELALAGGDERCRAYGGFLVVCHLGAVEAGGRADVQLVLEAVSPGEVVNPVVVGCAQAPGAFGSEDRVTVLGSEGGDGDADGDGVPDGDEDGGGPDGGEGADGDAMGPPSLCWCSAAGSAGARPSLALCFPVVLALLVLRRRLP